MSALLNAHEARVLGVLIEKAFTTPDQYPLSLNALTNGCNQKSNRAPVTDYSEAEVTVALTGLRHKHLAGASLGSGSRVERWRHNALEGLKVGERALAVLAELLVRGAQAPGELRTRASRMRELASLEELQKALDELGEQGLVRRVAGGRADRWAQTLCPEAGPAAGEGSVPSSGGAPGPSASAGLASPAPQGVGSSAPAGAAPSGTSPSPNSLEERVARLERQLAQLAEQLGATLDG
jgi:uncharacterized protein YceH (UPF0502 family)